MKDLFEKRLSPTLHEFIKQRPVQPATIEDVISFVTSWIESQNRRSTHTPVINTAQQEHRASSINAATASRAGEGGSADGPTSVLLRRCTTRARTPGGSGNHSRLCSRKRYGHTIRYIGRSQLFFRRDYGSDGHEGERRLPLVAARVEGQKEER